MELGIQVVGVVQVHLGHVDGHRAVHVNGQGGNAAVVFELPDPPQQLLRPAHRERGNEERATVLGRVPDDPRKLGVRLGRVIAIAVGTLENHDVGGAHRFRIAQHRSVPPAKIAREHDASG